MLIHSHTQCILLVSAWAIHSQATKFICANKSPLHTEKKDTVVATVARTLPLPLVVFTVDCDILDSKLAGAICGSDLIYSWL